MVIFKGCVVSVGLSSSSSSNALVTVARDPPASTTESSRISGRETDMTRLECRRRSDRTRLRGDLTLNMTIAIIIYSADNKELEQTIVQRYR